MSDSPGQIRHRTGIQIAILQVTLGVAFVQPAKPLHRLLHWIADDIGLVDLGQGGMWVIHTHQSDSAGRMALVDEDAIEELGHGHHTYVIGIGGHVEDFAASHLHFAIDARIHSGRDARTGHILSGGFLQLGPLTTIEALPLRRHVHVVEAALLLASID